MLTHELARGRGRTRIKLTALSMGSDLVVLIHNRIAHLGAAATGEYDFAEERASTSVITRLGHKDDAIAVKAAHDISKATKRPVCVIAGVHLDDITQEEIHAILANADAIVSEFIASLVSQENQATK